MYWHIDTDIVSLVVITAIYIYYAQMVHKDADSLRNRRFRGCLRAGIVITIIDIAASIVMEVPVSRFVYHLLMTPYFASMELVIVEWFLYAVVILYHDEEKRIRTISRAVLASYAAYALFACLNPWTGMFFSLGPNLEYQRGPCFALMVVLYAIYAIALFALILARRKHIPPGYPGGVLLLVPLILAVAIAVQLLNPGWLMILPAYMICLVLAFLFLQTMRARSSAELVQNLSVAAMTDQMTGLLNRMGMSAQMQRSLTADCGKDCLVLLVDIDDLKRINDTLGHAEGDRAICAVATRLRSHFRTYDIVARYGGDEFLVYLTGTLNEALIHRTLRRLVDELAALRIGENDEMLIHASVGAACGVVGGDDFEILCSHADAALYHVKRSGKNGYAVYRPEMDCELHASAARLEAPVS